MEPWYKKSFGKDYLQLYQHRDASEAQNQVELLAKLVSLKTSDRILDMACGAGRHLSAFYDKGYTNLIGIDLSDHLLSEAQKYFLENKTSSIALAQADMRFLPFNKDFDVIVSLFTSFGYFNDDNENLLVLKNAYSCLSSHGIMLLDYLNSIHVIKNIVKSEKYTREGVEYDIIRTHDVINKRINKSIKVRNAGKEETYHESVRLYTGQELFQMFSEAGFKDIKLFGDLKGSPYNSESSRLIVKAAK